MNKQKIMTIDCTPTWLSLLPFIIERLEGNNIKSEEREFLHSELRKMAKAADSYVTIVKHENQ